MMWNNSIKQLSQTAAKHLTLSEEGFLSAARNIAFVLGFAVLTGLAAGIKIEMGFIPLTMQTLAVMASGIFLDKEKAFLSQTLYLAYGILGIPWFSRGGGG